MQWQNPCILSYHLHRRGRPSPKGPPPGAEGASLAAKGPRKVVACAPAYRWPQELTFRFEGWVPLGRRPLNFTLPRAETEQIKPYVYLVKSLKIYTETGIYRTGLHVNGIMNNNYRYWIRNKWICTDWTQDLKRPAVRVPVEWKVLQPTNAWYEHVTNGAWN